ncbi:hypothetical protein QN277_024847 [Acacia crassicarpa]|uniref:Lipoxygenase n=1 Tax=Acacia crassicarpa TaxID=499986 RepID=A0AAE1JEQ4_9FABA|nr:hypothetical protein QN277_024847 [Acacia crassicarpa]
MEEVPGRETVSSKRMISSRLSQKRSDVSVHNHQKAMILKGTFVVVQNEGQSGGAAGKSSCVQIYSGTELDPKTGKGKLSDVAHFKGGKRKKQEGTTETLITYRITIRVDLNFGIPLAFLIKNPHNKKRFYLQHASIETPTNQIIHFPCSSWIYPFKNIKSHRIFFSNTCYIPRETPRGLVGLRMEEIERMRGNGESGERKEWERIYEYEVYNDLGDPQNPRPALGRSRWYPYPRRLRTGRQPSSSSMSGESRPESMLWNIYVPADERCSPKKLNELQSKAVQAFVYFVIPELKLLLESDSSSDDTFRSFQEILNLFSPNRDRKVEGSFRDTIKNTLVPQLAKAITHQASLKSPLRYPLPQIISEDEWAWMDDMEFARQMLAGIHPLRIQRLKIFPPQSKTGMNSSIESAHIEHNLEGLTLPQAVQEGRIFILDHHDYLIPFLNRINTNGVCAYASRTLLLLRNDGTLKPLAIELSLPSFSVGNEQHRVFLPAEEGVEAALWQLAKAHVAANDNLYHQLICHWLHTHAVVEPFIIATRRRLSVMHPIHRILSPHFKDTIHINALARCILVNAEGILEKTLFSGEKSMEISSELYKQWRFNEQGLPADLLKRGLAIEDPDANNPVGIQLILEDYPYATDGLEIWVAIKQWVKDFCSFFYKNDDAVKSDAELQAWWTEIQHVGHGDKRNETWWKQMTNVSNLVEELTTLIWIASAMHASINYGQYAYSGYPPGRPTLCRQFIPDEGTYEFGEFLKDPDKFFLKMLPGRFEMSLGVALVEVLSQHTCDEVYLGCQPSPEWIDNEEVRKRFAQFGEELKRIQTRILGRNNDPRLKNRRGPAKMTYNLLYPNTTSSGSKGVMGRGIPNSISI